MGDHQHGHAFATELLDDPQHPVDHFRIQCRSGLVKHQQLRIHSHGAGDAHTLLLPAGQCARIPIMKIGKSHTIELLNSDLAGFIRLDSLGIHQRFGHILQCRLVQKQVVVLKHEPDFRTHLVNVGRFGSGQIHKTITEIDGTGIRVLKEIQNAQQCGFTGA